jgi:hypothetical protein
VILLDVRVRITLDFIDAVTTCHSQEVRRLMCSKTEGVVICVKEWFKTKQLQIPKKYVPCVVFVRYQL